MARHVLRSFLNLFPRRNDCRRVAMITCCLWAGTLHVAAQDSPLFSTLSMHDGLPSNIISAVAQDTRNFIWVGTANGLCRYDGHRFLTFKQTESEHSLTTNEISSLVAIGDYLWIGTWKGLCRIHTGTFEVTRIPLGEDRIVRTLAPGRRGILWVGTATGLIRYDTYTGTHSVLTAEANHLSHNTVRAIYEDTAGTVWVGTYDGLNKLPSGQSTFTRFDLKKPYKPALRNNLICGDIRPYSSTSDSLLWVGTETGLCLFNTYTGRYQQYTERNTRFSNEVIKCIYPDAHGNLWLGTDFGLNVFDPKTSEAHAYFHNPRLPYSIANNVIWQIFEDNAGITWFVTSNGLSRMNGFQPFYRYQEVSYPLADQTVGNQVKAVLVTRNNVLWLATLHGVIRIDPEKNTRRVFEAGSPENNRIQLNNTYALEEDDYGRIWIGTAGGINVWDEAQQKMYAIPANATNGLTSNYIARFTKGTDGSFWVSAWEGGLFKVVGNFRELQALRFERAGEFGSPKTVSGANAIWTTPYTGLLRIDLQTHKSTSVPSFNRVAGRQDINCFYFSRNGRLWAGTTNALIEYNPQTDSAIRHPLVMGKDILPASITEDATGNIWCAAGNLLLKLSAQNAQVELLPLDDEIPLKSFFEGCVTHTPAGEIIFGGDNGYVTVSPQVKPNSFAPQVYITSLEVNHHPLLPGQTLDGETLLTQDIAVTPSLELEYAHRSIAFEFSALHYWKPAASVYAYRLDGFDNDWNYVSGEKNFAVYSNLTPGTYTFQVKGTNNYGLWSPHVATVQIRVHPPLLLSPLFLVFYAVLIVALILLALRTYTSRLNLRNELRITRLEKEHAEEIVQTKQQFFTNISHELRTPISLILPPLQQLLKRGDLPGEGQLLIGLAEKNAQRLLRLVNQILDFRKLEDEALSLRMTAFDLVPFCRELCALFSDKAGRHDIRFSFASSTESCRIWADQEKVETILFNLLSNAFKFTPRGGSITATLTLATELPGYRDGAVQLVVADTGIGIATEELPRIFDRFYQTDAAQKMEIGSGIGLTLVAEYARLHQGDIQVTSIPGQGATFTLTLPLGSGHLPIDSPAQQEIDLVAVKADHAGAEENTYHLGLASDKPLILIIEDNADIITFIQASLHDKYNFITASNGEEGLDKTTSFLPELIISDIMMPVMDGLTMCRQIKSNPKTSHIAVIMLTARTLTSQQVEGLRTGADSYLTKPFDIDLLEAHMDHLLQRKQELADYFRHELILQPEEGSGENVDDKFIKKVMSIIEANIANPEFSVEMLSDEVGMSSTHLYRKLKSTTRLSPNDIIRKYRIKKASLLLANKEGNISEIMYAVGFSNLSYFSKCFKGEFGITPKEYQQKAGTRRP
ncbi:response regulator [Fulvivirgaceae bacterium PWU5]|uniref:histidine kinase n=1 Tax=Dawidia cretensis TaxID=2782350 RepID=A0AAP2GV10_9BACT|nr:hybrid sensor histidine kinase/response regulator transcription factor [Dawidia cretensis]MBT1709695.1 response regulator [Dawidia cretensis]